MILEQKKLVEIGPLYTVFGVLIFKLNSLLSCNYMIFYLFIITFY